MNLSPKQALRRGAVAALGIEREGQSLKGRINVYACTPPLASGSMKGGCGYWIVTIDRDTGVTPMFVKCGHCGGMATSRMYRVGAGLEPTHEWFRPSSPKEIPRQYRNPAALQHIASGGLVMRPIGKGELLAPTPETKAFVEREQAMFADMLRRGRQR